MTLFPSSSSCNCWRTKRELQSTEHFTEGLKTRVLALTLLLNLEHTFLPSPIHSSAAVSPSEGQTGWLMCLLSAQTVSLCNSIFLRLTLGDMTKGLWEHVGSVLIIIFLIIILIII